MRYFVLLVALMSIGCVTTRPGGNLSDINPELGTTLSGVQNTVDGYSFHLDGGKMISSRRAGVLVNKSILDHWTAVKRIESHEQVDNPGAFNDTTRYHISLGGTQEGDSNVGLQFFSGLTLGIVPYTVNTTYALEYTLVDTKTGCIYKAQATDSVKAIVGWVAVPWNLATIFSRGGSSVTMTRLSNHLYDRLRKDGAFEATTEACK